MYYLRSHTQKTRSSILSRTKGSEHKKTRARKGDERTHQKNDDTKNTYDLKGKHFSCYPFLTSFGYGSSIQSRLLYTIQHLFVCVEKRWCFFPSSRFSFLTSFEACCSSLILLVVNDDDDRIAAVVRTLWNALRTQMLLLDTRRYSGFGCIEIKCLCCCSYNGNQLLWVFFLGRPLFFLRPFFSVGV